MLYYWNNGSPQKAKVTGSGNRQKLVLADGSILTGKISPDPDNDLYAYEVVRAPKLQYQNEGGQSHDNDGWTITTTIGAVDIPLDQAKDRHKTAVTQQFREARDGGVDITVGETTIKMATTHDARTEIKALTERLTGEDTQNGVTRAGTLVQFNVALAGLALAAIDDHHAAANAREYELYGEIEAAADMAAVRLIDVSTGWPGAQ